MCRNIKTLFNFDPPATEEEIRSAALQFVRKLSGSMVVDLLRAHPLTVMNGVLHENPFYTPAEELLRELQQRRAS